MDLHSYLLLVFLLYNLHLKSFCRNHVGIDNMKHSETYNVYCLTQRFRTKYTTYQFFVSKYDTQIIL